MIQAKKSGLERSVEESYHRYNNEKRFFDVAFNCSDMYSDSYKKALMDRTNGNEPGF